MKHVHRKRLNKVRRSSSNGHHSDHHTGVLIKEQSQSVLRGDHPMAFVLPTVRINIHTLSYEYFRDYQQQNTQIRLISNEFLCSSTLGVIVSNRN